MRAAIAEFGADDDDDDDNEEEEESGREALIEVAEVDGEDRS